MFLSIILSFGCKNYEQIGQGESETKLIRPPMTQRIDFNFYADVQEINNLDYLEYLTWTAKVFGEASQEYKDAIPDQRVTAELGQLNNSKLDYFHNRKYDLYPVVGVSHKQAINYTKWRTDRVGERILIERGIIEKFPQQNRENYFSLEKYTLSSKQPWAKNRKSVYLPIYRIPTEREWMSIAQASVKALQHEEQSKYNKKVLKAKGYLFNTKEYDAQYEWDGPIACKSLAKDENDMFDLLGNVSEIVLEKSIAKGGSWKHEIKDLNIENQIAFEQPNSWTGFRNVCSWEMVMIDF